ncbi:biorientation of chromosomes in cell division protein 1-like 1 isoform X2 [Pristis pectinata]|uniref:biorientation of chromosomes in cell division protein 1-like 1 isoform X2 n=1 Tax=Pristis pectinata TaxID=685728 RepID=UPI00223E402C|nr:biorientation of chromosomes in cell division protein 1-like 1 isoform X2 [Pristis pectinata]
MPPWPRRPQTRLPMIVNHLKNQGLFDQFRRDCLADVDTKPAYQNLRQRVDNFVSNHLASHTWSPHLNKNQLRNSLRQMVLQSGMLEVGVDRIISQVVDPKINHIFRPQVEKAVHEFLATVDRKEEPASANVAQNSEKQEPTTPGPSSCPSTSKANDALSILDTITSLNQEASAARSTVENSSGKNCEKNSRKISTTEIKSQSFDLGTEKDHVTEETEKFVLEAKVDDGKLYPKSEGLINALTSLKDFEDKHEKAETVVENIEDVNEKSDKIDKRDKDVIRSEQLGLSKNERRGKRKDCESVRHISGTLIVKQTAKENLKKEYFLEDSDFEGLSDITVSSVHTSDLSSFDEEDDEEEGEVPASDSSDEFQEQSSEEKEMNLETNEGEQKEGKAKPGRHPYVHKPFLYSKYYNDSDDEETVVQRRQSIAKEKAERLLRRQWNRERVEDKHKQLEIEKDRPPEEIQRNEENLQTLEKGINSNLSVESNSRKMQQPSALISKVSKAALKEQKILEKKVALRRKRKGDLRTLSGEIALHHEDRKRKRELPEEFKETQIRTEFLFQNKEKAFASTSKDSKNAQTPDQPLRSVQILSEFNGESSNHLKIDDESCQKQPRNNNSDMSGLETSHVNKLDDFGIEENLKEPFKHRDEMKHVKHSDGELVVSESGSWTCDSHTNADPKVGTALEDSVITNCHQVILSGDSKALISSDSAELSISEHGQDIKSRDHSKLKEEKVKEKKHVAEGSWPKSRETTQEGAKGHEKNKEKRNESECLRPKFKENLHDDVKSSEKWKEKRNDSENPCLKFKESIYEDAKSREKKNESEHGRTKSRENTLDEKGHEKSKEKKYMSECSRSLSKESLQEDAKGSEKGKERKAESGSSRSKSREKMHDDTRSHEKVKENQNESGSSRSKSRETVQEDVRNKDKRKNFENARSRSKEELPEDKSREKRVEKRRESESSKSKEKVDGSRSKTKESIELSRSKSKEDNEYNQKGIEKRHDSETARLKMKEHSEITRSKSREKLQGDVQYDEKVEKRRDSENTRPKFKDNVDGSRSKSKDKVRDTIQNEKGIEKKHSSENPSLKSKEYTESSHSKVKEKMRDFAQGTMKGIDKKHDSKIRHFEKSRSRSKEDLQEDNAKKMERRYDFGSTRSKSGERSEHSRSKSKEHSESSRSKYKERVQENIQNNEKGMDRKHKNENTLSKTMEHSEMSQSKSSEKGKESIKDSEKGKLKKNDFQNVQSKSKEFSENVQAKSKDKIQGDEKGSEKGNFVTIQSCSKEKVQDLQGNEKLEEKEIKLPAALFKPKTGHEDEQSREKSSKLKNVAKYEEQVEIAKTNEMEERNKVENDQSGSKAHLQKDIKNQEIVEEKNIKNLEFKEWSLEENETTDMKEKAENIHSKSNEVQNDQTNDKKGTDTENVQLNLKESIPDTKEIAHNTPGNLAEIENLIKTEDKLEERIEISESERSKAGSMEDIPVNMEEKELETEQKEIGGCKTSQLVKEQTEKPAYDQLARPNEINIPPNIEQHGSLPTPYQTFSPDNPTMNDAGLLHPIAAKTQFFHYDPSSPATPTLDENFSYEAPSSVPDSVVPSVEGPGKQEAHSSENIAEELCDKNQVDEMDTKCEPSKVELQELPVQQDVVSEINTSAICEWKDEDVTGESVKGAEEQSSSKRERKPKRPYTPVENPPKRRHLHSEEKSAVVDEPIEAILVQAQEESPAQSRGKITSKVEEKASQANDASSQNKPTTRAAKKVSSPEHLSISERERRSLTSTKEKPTTDSKAGKSPALVSVTRSRSQPSPVTKQGRKREASPERKRRQHKAEVPPKRTRR